MDTIQNREPATSERSVKIPSGGINPSLVRSLHTIMLKPKIAYARNAAPCPRMDSCLAILLYAEILFNECNKTLKFLVVDCAGKYSEKVVLTL